MNISMSKQIIPPFYVTPFSWTSPFLEKIFQIFQTMLLCWSFAWFLSKIPEQTFTIMTSCWHFSVDFGPHFDLRFGPNIPKMVYSFSTWIILISSKLWRAFVVDYLSVTSHSCWKCLQVSFSNIFHYFLTLNFVQMPLKLIFSASVMPIFI